MTSKISIIIAREYLTRVKKKSFILLTLTMPFLMAALVVVPILLGMVKDDTQQTIAIVDKTHCYEPLFTSTSRFRFDIEPAMKPEFREESSGVQAVVVINDNLAKNPDGVTIYSREEVQLELRQAVEKILESKIHADKLAAYDVPELDDIITDMQQPINMHTVKWDKDGNESISSADVAMGLGFISALLIYMFVMSYGGMVMAGVTEEKTSRIIEVMVSSVRPFQLMMGKIIGVMLVGLTQMLIWGTMLTLILTSATFIFGGQATADTVSTQIATANPATAMAAQDSMPMGAEIMQIIGSLPLAEIALMFVLCFLGGYLLYASIFAACGAAVNNQEDSSQFMMPIIILMIFGLYAAMGSIENTNGPLAFWTSLFPFTAPVVMMTRIPFGIPLWQEILSMLVLYATDFLFIYISARIYRVGILMYGKKPTFHDLWKWMRY